MSNEKLGLLTEPHEHQELYKIVDGVKYFRYPVRTPLVLIGDNLNDFIEKYAKPYFKQGDIFCISTKVVSIAKGYYVAEKDIKITPFARFLVKFVKKWPHDPGFALPQKIQLSMDIVGVPRFIFALIGGAIMKYIFRKPGYFYILAGHNIGAIDGFVDWMYPEPLRGYGFLAPKFPDRDANEIEEKFGIPTALLDGNNVENIVLGMSDGLKKRFSKEKFLKIIEGNPQGQSGGTPILLVREEEGK